MSGGIVEINGSSFLSATSNIRATIQNFSSGTVKIGGGTIISTQFSSILNDGSITIDGNPTLKSSASNKPSIQNSSTGSLTILGGTITSSQNVGINNNGTVTIGQKNGVVNLAIPQIQGATYGITTSGNINFYDGIIKGTTKGINNENKVVDKEDNSRLLSNTIIDNDVTYYTSYISLIKELKTVYQYNGDYIFDGTNFINTGIKLFSKDAFYKNFEISFTIKEYTLDGSKQPTILNSKNEDSTSYEGFLIRLKENTSQLEASPKGCRTNTVNAFDDISNNMKFVIERKNNIIYIRQNDVLCYECDFNGFTKYFNTPITIGASYKNNTPIRYFTGILSNIEIKVEE